MSENRDRAEKRIELRNAPQQQAMQAIEQFFSTENWGRIGFEKTRESFSLWASSECEPT